MATQVDEADRLAPLKAELADAIADAKPDGSYGDAEFARVHAAIAALVPLTPTPRPIDAQAFVASPWAGWYAQYGPRHTAGKPIKHETMLNLLSFNKMPKVPVIHFPTDQEIRVEGNHYNNVHDLHTPDGKHRLKMVLWGRYRLEPDEPQRYVVDFYAVELFPLDGASADDMRACFGIPADHPLRVEMKPPKLHSDVVYCDDDIRINFGSMGGVYVMKRLHTPGKSVSFG